MIQVYLPPTSLSNTGQAGLLRVSPSGSKWGIRAPSIVWRCHLKHGRQPSWKVALEGREIIWRRWKKTRGSSDCCPKPNHVTEPRYKGDCEVYIPMCQEEGNEMRFGKHIALSLPQLSWFYPYWWHNQLKDPRDPKHSFHTSQSCWICEMSMSPSL